MEFIISPAILALVPIIIALVQLAKLYIDSRYAPLLSLALGLGGAFLIDHTAHVGVTVISGVVIGLTAAGLYAGAKATMAPVPETVIDTTVGS